MKTKCKVCGKDIDVVSVTCGEGVEKQKELIKKIDRNKKYLILSKIEISKEDTELISAW